MLCTSVWWNVEMMQVFRILIVLRIISSMLRRYMIWSLRKETIIRLDVRVFRMLGSPVRLKLYGLSLSYLLVLFQDGRRALS